MKSIKKKHKQRVEGEGWPKQRVEQISEEQDQKPHPYWGPPRQQVISIQRSEPAFLKYTQQVQFPSLSLHISSFPLRTESARSRSLGDRFSHSCRSETFPAWNPTGFPKPLGPSRLPRCWRSASCSSECNSRSLRTLGWRRVEDWEGSKGVFGMSLCRWLGDMEVWGCLILGASVAFLSLCPFLHGLFSEFLGFSSSLLVTIRLCSRMCLSRLWIGSNSNENKNLDFILLSRVHDP